MILSIDARRRDLLRLAGVLAAGACLPRAAQAQPRWWSYPFTLGVASGSPGPDSTVLWTRLAPAGLFEALGDASIAVRWEVAHDESFARIAVRGETLATADLGHSVHAEVAGLEPDRWYFYRFICGNAVSATGRARTLPLPGAAVARLRLAYASCQRWEHGYYAAYRHMRDEQLDYVMFLGDYIYEYPNAAAAVRGFPTLGLVRTLAEYRQRYALHRSDAHLQAMHANCSWIVSWDDHEVQNDYAGVYAGDDRPLGLNAAADFLARRDAAYQAYYEHMPLRASAYARGISGAEVRLYTRYRFGQLADLLMLDSRQYRDPQACGHERRPAAMIDAGGCDALRDPARTMLGAAQERWLDAALGEADSRWSVLGQQTLFGRRMARTSDGRERLWNDGWDGYPAARARLTDSLRQRSVAKAVLLGGDVHENWVGHVKADYTRPDSASVGVEFCGTSITSRASGAKSAARRLAENPHFVFAEGEKRGYGVCEFTPGRLTTSLRVVDDVTRPDARIETLARFEVQGGRPVIEQA
ncbi:MAG TPA: alkaline phosphatase D family protein [Ramlibacter sp.]|nr:alkaline phosphatase D family protein [Ramlibacter sp.]